jgi:hypothetical protein
MHGAIPTLERRTQNFTQKASPPAGQDFASEEIYAYVAARDTLLTEAEEEPSAVTVKRARLANDFVENCLRPASVPYGGQFLSEQEAVRERQRCRNVSARIAQLSGR